MSLIPARIMILESLGDKYDWARKKRKDTRHIRSKWIS